MRFIYLVFRMIIFFLGVEFRYWKIKRLEKLGKIEEKDELLLLTSEGLANCVLKSMGVKVEVEGLENLPPEGTPYVLTPNHSSFFDIPVILYALNRVVGFVSKKENKKLPFIGRWITLLYSVYIDRSSARSAIKSLNDGVEIVKRGYPQVIFPEGTRTIDGKVHEFKAGSYKLAQKAGALVIPVSISGTYELMKKGSIKINPGIVKIKFLKALDSELGTMEMASVSQELITKEIEKEVKIG